MPYAGKRLDESTDTGSGYSGRRLGTTAGDYMGSAGGGFNVGLTKALGAPVDLVNLGLGMIGLGTEEPFLGSTSLQRGASSLGMTPEPGQPYPVPYVGRTMEEVGGAAGALMPFMGLAQRGTRVAQLGRESAKMMRPPPSTKVGRIAEAIKRGPEAAIRMAQQRPKPLALAEGAAATSAGIGASLAQELFPGDPTAELVGQLAGGFLNPTGILVSQTPRAIAGAKNIIYPMTKKGARRQAAGRVQELAEDPQEALRRLEQYQRQGPLVPGEKLTPAQITGNKGLMKLERAVARSSHELEGEIGEKAAATNRAMMEEAADIRTPTDPGETKTYFDQRRKYTSDLLDQRLERAALKARQRVERLEPGLQRQQANVIAREELDSALSDARVTERDKWAEVPRDVVGKTTGAKEVYRDILAEIRAEKGDIGEVAPESIRRRLRELSGEERKALSEGEAIGDNRVFLDEEPIKVMTRLRSDILQEVRNEKGREAPDWDKVRQLNKLGDAVLKDMMETLDDDPALTNARDFSRILNEKFQRGTVGKLLGYEKVGGASVPAELTLERSVGRFGPQGAVDEAALMRAVEDIDPQTMQMATGDYLRSRFLEQVDPQRTGRINPGTARTWLNRNSALMERYPELRQQFQRAAGDEQAARELADVTKGRQGAINDRLKSATALYIKAQPETEIGRIRNLGRRGPSSMRSLVNTARKDPSGNALKGLKSAYIEDLMKRSYTQRQDVRGGRFLDGQEMLNLLNKDKDLTASLLNGGDIKRLTQIGQRAQLLEEARRSGRDINEILKGETNELFDMLARISGAQIGGRLGAGAAGTPLVAAGAGSRFMRRVTEKIPIERVSDVLTQAALDEKLMTDLLKRADTDLPSSPVTGRLNAWLVNAIPEYQDVYGEEQP